MGHLDLNRHQGLRREWLKARREGQSPGPKEADLVATDVKAFSPSPPTEQDLIGQDLNSRYLNAQGGPEVVGAGGSARPLAFQ